MRPEDIEVLLNRLSLLATLVRQLGDCGKIKLQKLAYFLQECHGVPLGYRFRMYYYGPYSDEIEGDLSTLKMIGAVDVKQDPDGYGYHVTLRQDGDAQLPDDWAKRHKRKIAKVLEEFGDYDATHLELVATLHFAAKCTPDPTRQAVISVASRWKPKFSAKELDNAYQELVALGYVS